LPEVERASGTKGQCSCSIFSRSRDLERKYGKNRTNHHEDAYLFDLFDKNQETYSRNQSKSESEWNDMLENSGPGPTEKAGGKTMRRIQAVAKVC